MAATSREVSLAYVDADGAPMDMTGCVVINAWMVAIPALLGVLGLVTGPDRSSVRAGLQLGGVGTLATACASRIWTLAHDRRHRTAPRQWWEVHHEATRRRSRRGSLAVLAALVEALAASLSRDHDFAAATLTGPIVEALFADLSRMATYKADNRG